jgi:DNA-binding transcriptional MerR regulator
MQFTEPTAKAIAEKYGLSPSTIKVWRTRKSIPDRYADPGFTMRKQLTPAQELLHEKLVNVLKSGKITLKSFAELCSIPAHRYQDAMRPDNKAVNLSQDDLKRSLAILKQIRLQIQDTFAVFSPGKLEKLLKHPAITYSRVITQPRELIYKISYVRSGKGVPDQELWEQAKDKYFVLSLEINL